MLHTIRNASILVLVIAALAYIQNIPSVLEQVLWVQPNALPKLDGVLAPNNLLTSVNDAYILVQLITE